MQVCVDVWNVIPAILLLVLAEGLNTAQIASLCLGLENVKLPPKINKRGRPKVAEKTVIGLPCKKKKKTDKPTPFLKE